MVCRELSLHEGERCIAQMRLSLMRQRLMVPGKLVDMCLY